MGRLANAARVAAVMDPDPAAVVAVLDRALRAYDDTLATALLAVYDPHDGVLRWARAGHPPPALARPDDDAVLVEPPARPPLGGPVDLAIDPPPVHEVRLPPGSVCALFTDGLVERRGEHIDDGLGRVTTALGRAPRLGDPERIADRIMEACAPVDVDDDVCLLVLATR
jgi:serine phosphatase RsbU (regulator of sigma subunit)